MFMKECKTIQKVIFILAVICVSITQSWADSWKEIFFADPTIFVENGKYYLTGTRNREPQGFAILESTDLKHWTVPNGKDLQLILRKETKLSVKKASGHLNTLRIKELIISLIPLMSKQ